MDKIELYLEEVRRHLPSKMRPDILAELRSTIEDMLEDRAQGQEPDEALTLEILKEMGHPEKVAASYLPERCLIGPQLFPAFWVVLRIVLAVVTVMAVVNFAASFSQSDLSLLSLGKTLGEAFLEWVTSIMTTLGNIVLVFAGIQWAWPELRVVAKDKAWDPSTLKETPDGQRIQPLSLVWEITVNAALLILFNLYQDQVGIYYFRNHQWTMVPVLTGTFFHYLPFMNIIWSAQIAKNLILLRQGVWTTLTRWFNIAIRLGTIALAAVLLKAGSLVSISPEAADHWPLEFMFIDQLVRWILIIVIIVEGVELFKVVKNFRMVEPISLTWKE